LYFRRQILIHSGLTWRAAVYEAQDTVSGRPEAGVEPEGVDLGNHGVSLWCDAAVKGYRHP